METAPELTSIVTTTYVFDEVVTFFNACGRHQKAVEVGRRLLESRVVEMIRVNEALFEAGWSRFQARPDKRYSLTDCISFVVMSVATWRRPWRSPITSSRRDTGRCQLEAVHNHTVTHLVT